MPCQMYSDKKVNRKSHVWRKFRGGGYKCVLCGGFVSSNPSDTSDCESYERLDETDRKLCPPPNK